MDLFLKFTDEAEAGGELSAVFGPVDWNLQGMHQNRTSFVAERIEIPVYGEPDENGIAPVTGYEPGVHINVRIFGDTLADFKPEHIVTPTTPARVFF